MQRLWNLSARRPARAQPCLTFSPLAWLKLQYFCHAGDTEIGGFGVAADDDPLYVEDFVTVRQHVSAVTVRFEDAAVADFSDRCVDVGLAPARFARIWCHTHPGDSVTPSDTDEETFATTFGSCDWSLMFILGRTGRTYARLAFAAGPGGAFEIPVAVDWSAWAAGFEGACDELAGRVRQWREEYAANVVLPVVSKKLEPAAQALQTNGLGRNPWTEFDGLISEPYWEEDGYYDPIYQLFDH